MSDYFQGRESVIQFFEDISCPFKIGVVHLEVNSSQGVGVEGKDADGHFVEEIMPDVFLFEQEFKDREFVGVGKDGQSMKIFHHG